MDTLKNIKHEKFARELVASNGNQTEAYAKVYDVDKSSAGASAPRLLENASVRERISTLLDSVSLGLPELSARLKQFVHSENEGIALKAVEDGFKLHGCFDEQKIDANIGTINIVFGDAVKNVVEDSTKHFENKSNTKSGA